MARRSNRQPFGQHHQRRQQRGQRAHLAEEAVARLRRRLAPSRQRAGALPVQRRRHDHDKAGQQAGDGEQVQVDQFLARQLGETSA